MAEQATVRSIRFPAELDARLVALAKREKRSINAQVVYLLEQALPPEKPNRSGKAMFA
jgi:hypothetical protein